ncbi:MAG: ATP-dependent RNA helicase RhlB [gamma proteobacterium endosymbiont of Lamellibrachia anaximandri]|nr:ATP-dependent RNA helicase RhlB [gamma proteobacterium endosymbiont of Lamellibrachia anaximandri]MBL3532661.1 ATP-dependent RNA helicase RhlB [gamma proteobacterium endosymbiont of Lamellibrachia anaximandri]MBL3599015.1 ATP-dependent RNA helicase RhlB [gamma proteobacterium endosymbiont of Lamellibrachia anaximandri]
MSEKHLTDTRFDSFDLAPEIQQGIAEAGFTYCTPIQAEALPIALTGQDLAGQAQTGTGKTAAFLVATLQHLTVHPADESRRANQPRALMVAPTRELAVQIHNDAVTLTKRTNFTSAVVFGGTGYEEQRRQLQEGVDLLIGTPGRLIDYLKQGVYDLRAIQVIVLDEADRMFDLGFIKDIRFMLRRCPKPEKRLGMLFSATLSYRVKELAYEHMNNPQNVEVEPEQVTAENVREVCYMTANEEKIPLLIGLLRSLENSRTIVFINTKRTADKVWGFLQGNGIETAVLSGDVPQKKRLSLLKKFQNGEVSVLVATDVAARGLHISDVSHVVNFDLPEDAEDYVHRIGRTARAGASGDAISFACETHAFSLPDIETYVGHRIPLESVDQALLAEIDPKSRIYPEKGSRNQRHQKDGRKSHGKGHHHRGHKRPDGSGKPHRRRRSKPPEGGGTQ